VRIVLDTNVFVSGVFFGDVPGRILDAWRDARVRLVLSAEILEEYQRVGQVLGARYPGVVSGDKDLLDQSGWRGVRVLRSRQFADEFLSER
jgi:predicted nucleic acid-binding protein